MVGVIPPTINSQCVPTEFVFSFPTEKKNNYEKEEEENFVHKKCLTIDGKYTCAGLAMADEPTKEGIEPLPDLNEKNAQRYKHNNPENPHQSA
jgi:hypothetical protein